MINPAGPSIPLLGQQQTEQQREKLKRAAIEQAVQQLSFTIYTQAAAARVVTLDRPHQQLDLKQLHQLARDSHTAAQAFFEGLGVVEFGGE